MDISLQSQEAISEIKKELEEEIVDSEDEKKGNKKTFEKKIF